MRRLIGELLALRGSCGGRRVVGLSLFCWPLRVPVSRVETLPDLELDVARSDKLITYSGDFGPTEKPNALRWYRRASSAGCGDRTQARALEVSCPNGLGVVVSDVIE
jgi:hypothetical protein